MEQACNARLSIYRNRNQCMEIPVSNQLWSEQEAPMQPCGDSQHQAANAKLKRQVGYLLPNLLCH